MKIPLYLQELRQGIQEQDQIIANIASRMPHNPNLMLGIVEMARIIIQAYELRVELLGKVQAIEIAVSQSIHGITEEV